MREGKGFNIPVLETKGDLSGLSQLTSQLINEWLKFSLQPILKSSSASYMTKPVQLAEISQVTATLSKTFQGKFPY